MKKYLLLSAIFLSTNVFSQTIRASLGTGSTLNRVKIFLKTDATVANNLFATLQFNIAIPAGTAPMPSVSVASNAFGVPWTVATPYVESGYINYNILTSSSFQFSVTANVEFEAMEINFSGGPNTPMINAAHLVCLPDGGAGNNGNGLFYCTGGVASNGQDLFYARTNVTVSNGDTYAPIHGSFIYGPSGTVVSYARYAPAVLLPIKVTDFTVVKRNNDGLVSWIIENQDYNTSNFEVERSMNGRDFINIGNVNANLTSGSVGRYTYNDANIANISSSRVIYYRLKIVDRDGHFTYSEIRSIKLDSKAGTITIYPNPVKSFTNLVYDMVADAPVVVTVTDGAGKLMQRLEIAGQKGTNQTRIDMAKYAAGTYMVKIQAGDMIQSIPVIKSE